MVHHSGAWSQVHSLWFGAGEKALEVPDMNPKSIPLTCASEAQTINFTFGFMGHSLQVHLRQPDNLIVAVRLEGISRLGLDIDTMLTTGGKDTGLQTFGIPDKHRKVSSRIPLDWPT